MALQEKSSSDAAGVAHTGSPDVAVGAQVGTQDGDRRIMVVLN